MSQVLVINPILYTSETDRIPRVSSIKDTMIYTLCLGFLRAGHQVTLIAAQDYRPVEEETYEFPIIWMRTIWHGIFKPRCFPYMPGLGSYLRKHGEYEYIISSEVFATWSYAVARICPQRSVIWHELAKHNNMMHRIPSRIWYRFVAGLMMRKVTVVPRSEAAARFISQFLPKVSDTVIDHGVNIEKMVPAESGEKRNQFVVVSQLIGRKRIDRILESFAMFWSQGHRDYRLYIIGSGELEEGLRKQAELLCPKEAVVFCGQLAHGQLLPLVARSRALLVATEKDNNMVSIVESIAVGTPVVTTPVPYNAAYISSENLGIVEADWNEAALERICENNAIYTANCIVYRERLSNVYCAKQFLSVMS